MVAISIRVGLGIEGDDTTGGIEGTAGHGIHADRQSQRPCLYRWHDRGWRCQSGDSGSGIVAQGGGTDSVNIAIDASGTVEGAENGIVAQSEGTGGLSITTAAVTGRGGTACISQSIRDW